ncbi:heme peroxidase [Agyrium rufum]|nr:heme peroxidase [Agyrium rufum]
MATASTTRTFTRLATRSLLKPSAPLRPSPTTSTFGCRAFRQSTRRGYASEAGSASPTPPKGNTGLYFGLGAGVLALAGGAYLYTNSNADGTINLKEGSAKETKGLFTPTKEDYQKVYDAVAHELVEHDEYDDGSYGPVLVRLAWHCSGTYDKETGTGGSNGATMRFAPEGDHGANAGLKAARDFLQPVKEKFPWISYSDLWTLAGICALQEMQGPVIPWRPGRQDRDVSLCTPDGRLPDGAKEQSHLRAIFGRMGFDDREIVALSGAHALGRCHTDRSGFEGPWTFSPTTLTNDYYKLLLDETWNYRKWNGPKQFQDKTTKTLMMLPTDMALVKDAGFKKHVERYAKDNETFFNEFRDVVVKLFELGVPFTTSEEDRMVLKPTS